ncbi:hypothetical protein ACWCPJ_29370 [Streptomyces collinus]
MRHPGAIVNSDSDSDSDSVGLGLRDAAAARAVIGAAKEAAE